MTKYLLALFLLLCACRKNEPEAPTPEQSSQLNDAENMLDTMAQNEEGPEANASSPSNSSD